MSAPAAVTPAEPMFVQPKPYAFEAEPGKDYYYCTCGLSSRSDGLCDGSHRKYNTGLTPKKFSVTEKKTVYLCGCRLTKDPSGIYCDGTHRKEEGIKRYNQYLLKQNTELKESVAKLERNQKWLTGVSAALGVLGVAIAVRLAGN